MQDRDRGEPRQLPEMPRRELKRLAKWARSEKLEDRQKAIVTLGEMPAYRQVPELMRGALVPGISFDSIMIGVKTLHEFETMFGVGEELGEERIKELVQPLKDEDLRWTRMGPLLRWVHFQPAGPWAVNVFLELFDPKLKSWTWEACVDHYLPWFSKTADDLPEGERVKVADKLVGVLLSEPTYWYLVGRQGEEKVSGLIRRGIGVTLDNFSDEGVESILKRAGNIKAGEKKPGGFWTAVAMLCRVGDRRAETFLRERLEEDIPEDRSMAIQSAYHEPVVTKEDIGEALVAMGGGED